MFKFCWHDYGNWGKAIESCGGSFHQFCMCKKCGAIKRRTASLDMVATFMDKESEINESVIAAYKAKQK